MSEIREYTLTVYTENSVGLLGKIANLFTRRKINIESLNSSPSEIADIYRFTIVVKLTEQRVQNIKRQLEKMIDVLKVFLNTDEEIVWQIMAMYKVPTQRIAKDVKVERVLRQMGGNVVAIREDYTVFEVTGQDEEVNRLLRYLEDYELIEFVKSSRIAIIKANHGMHHKIMEMGQKH